VAASLGLNAVEDAAEAPLGDVVVECSGAPAAIPLALDRTVRGGRLVLVGICPETASISPLDIVTGEREILGSLSHHWGTDFAAAVELLADGSVQAEPIVTHRIPLAHALDHGLTALAEDPGKYLKIVVQPERIE
ncbi:MAG: Alcohol dehydrogenase zinc-binding domain protein, partial [Pseudonocardiales bacterium]|nr:Alcohol dehydrogenase zinc-binding domain protein [Pseudonocardiales bacterium]